MNPFWKGISHCHVYPRFSRPREWKSMRLWIVYVSCPKTHNLIHREFGGIPHIADFCGTLPLQKITLQSSQHGFRSLLAVVKWFLISSGEMSDVQPTTPRNTSLRPVTAQNLRLFLGCSEFAGVTWQHKPAIETCKTNAPLGLRDSLHLRLQYWGLMDMFTLYSWTCA